MFKSFFGYLPSWAQDPNRRPRGPCFRSHVTFMHQYLPSSQASWQPMQSQLRSARRKSVVEVLSFTFMVRTTGNSLICWSGQPIRAHRLCQKIRQRRCYVTILVPRPMQGQSVRRVTVSCSITYCGHHFHQFARRT